jgi:adenylate cyclase class 2
MLSVLSILGYSPILRYERWRETFSWGSAEVVIDELPFGWFMEIEGEAKEIQNIAQMLGLNMADGLTLSYVRIFENVRHVLGLSMPDLTFEAFKEIVVSPEAYRDQ